MQLHNLLEGDRRNRRVVRVGDFDPMVESEMAGQDLGAGMFARFPHRPFPRRARVGKLLSVVIEGHSVTIKMEEEAGHRTRERASGMCVAMVRRFHGHEVTSGPPHRALMQFYRLFFFTGDMHIDRAHEFEATDDAAAIRISEAWREGRKMELWQRSRLVKRWDIENQDF